MTQALHWLNQFAHWVAQDSIQHLFVITTLFFLALALRNVGRWMGNVNRSVSNHTQAIAGLVDHLVERHASALAAARELRSAMESDAYAREVHARLQQTEAELLEVRAAYAALRTQTGTGFADAVIGSGVLPLPTDEQP